MLVFVPIFAGAGGGGVMPTVECAPLPNQGGMRIWIDWSDGLNPDAPLRVERGQLGEFTDVRGTYEAMVPAATGTGPNVYHVTTCSQLVVWDYELTPANPVIYRVTDQLGQQTAFSAFCELPATDTTSWLINPLYPCRNIPLTDCSAVDCPTADSVVWVGHGPVTYAAANAQFHVLNYPRPVATYNVRKDAQLTLIFGALTCAASDKLLKLTEPGAPIYLPPFPAACWPGRYLQLGDHVVSPLAQDLTRQTRLHTIPAVVVDAPPGNACCAGGTTAGEDVSWCAMCDCVSTWDEFDALALTGRQVLEGAASAC